MFSNYLELEVIVVGIIIRIEVVRQKKHKLG